MFHVEMLCFVVKTARNVYIKKADWQINKKQITGGFLLAAQLPPS